MRIPADCFLLRGTDITVDEAIYNNGYQTVVKKSLSDGNNHRDNPDPFLLSRSLVLTGSGRAVILAVGKYTRISKQLEEEGL